MPSLALMMEDIDPLATEKENALAGWNRPERANVEGTPGSIAFENEQAPRPTRGGLAVGHSVDPKTGERRLELRVTAESGPNYNQARVIQRNLGAVLQVSEPPSVNKLPEAPPKVCGRREPLHIGASVSHQESAAGTLGAFVRLRDGRIGIVSCGHVLARLSSARARGKKKWGKRTDPVHQPGWPDEDPILDTSKIAALENFAPFVSGRNTNLDAALAVLDGHIAHTGNLIPNLPCVPHHYRGRQIAAPKSSSELTSGMRVVKMGRTTGWTEGTLHAFHFRNARVAYSIADSFTFFGVHEIRWDDGWEKDESKRYAAKGDSGSLVLLKDGLHPIGLHFASADQVGFRVSYVVPWPKIANTFMLELL